MVISSAQEISVNFGPRIILDKVNLTINSFDKIGIIGRNGAGKSTFLKIIADAMQPDSGKIINRNNLKVAYVPQHFELNSDATVFENISEGVKEIFELHKQYEATASHEIEAELTRLDGWDIENRIETVMHQMNAPDRNAICKNLSGGERRRVAICKAVVSEPDLLILDEPTNHLDTEAIEWLEKFLSDFKKSCLFVTHDRYFLDQIATKIVEIDNGNLYTYEGNYTDYLIQKAQRDAAAEAQEIKRKSFIRREIDWIRRGPKARGTKSKKRIERFDTAVSQKFHEEEKDVELIFPPAPTTGNIILELNNLSMNRGGKDLFRELNFHFQSGTKLGIVGKNGTGKSTLIKLILDQLKPDRGVIRHGQKTEYNYIDQERVQLNEEKTVIEEVGDGKESIMLGEYKISVWGYLKRFLFTDERINTPITQLSGGEKNRLLLAKMIKYGGNFLILDEPTNDLDLATLRVLEEGLEIFKGCVLVVSHDRYFLNRVCNKILHFDGEGNFNFYDGNYDYFREKLEEKEQSKRQSEKSPKAQTSQKAEKTEKPRRLTWKEKQEFLGIEEKILEAEEKVAEIEALFSSPDFHNNHGHRMTELNKELEEAREEVSQLYDRWDYLSAFEC